MSANVLLTEGPKRYGGVIYVPPAYILAMAFVLTFEDKIPGKLGHTGTFLSLGGFIALFFLFARPLEWIVLHGRNLPINIPAFTRVWKDSAKPRKERFKLVILGRLKDNYPSPPRKGKQKEYEAEGWFWSSFGSPYTTEPRAKTFGAAYFAISLCVLYYLKWERISIYVPKWVLIAVVSMIVLVSVWSFRQFLRTIRTVKRYYSYERRITGLTAVSQVAREHLMLARSAMGRNDWSEADIALDNLGQETGNLLPRKS